MEIKINKFKAAIKYLTGGIAGVVEYLLDLFNEAIQKLPADEVAKYAQLALDICNFIKNIAGIVIKDEKKKKAALETAEAFDALAKALLDSKLTSEELDLIVNEVKEAVEAWKEAK